MKKCSICDAKKPRSEFYIRASAPDGLRKECKQCVRERVARWVQANPARHAAGVEKWRGANLEKDKLVRRRARSKWAKEHPAQVNERNATRHASKMKAIPAWANRFFIKEAYELAVHRTALLGQPWEVDHIVPLRSALVCGLHVEHNLCVIPAVINQQKGNRHWPGMPEIREQL